MSPVTARLLGVCLVSWLLPRRLILSLQCSKQERVYSQKRTVRPLLSASEYRCSLAEVISVPQYILKIYQHVLQKQRVVESHTWKIIRAVIEINLQPLFSSSVVVLNGVSDHIRQHKHFY